MNDNSYDIHKAELKLEADVNEFLPLGQSRIDASFIVTPEGFDAGRSTHDRFICLLIDVSGSMDQPSTKMTAARNAACKAIDLLPPDTFMSVVAFSSRADAIFPKYKSGSARATSANKEEAKLAVKRLTAHGGTVMSAGLATAFEEFAKCHGAHGTCILLTDGENNGDDVTPLARVLEQLADCRKQGAVFQVQCRGVGTDWHVSELRKIAEATLGDVPKVIGNPSEMEADFAECLHSAMSTSLQDVRINIWVPQTVQILELKQISPTIVSLTNSGITGPDGQTRIFTTGAWDSEAREYYVAFKMNPGDNGKRICAGRLSLSYKYNNQEFTTPQPAHNVVAVWTDDQGKSARIPMGVARAKGNVELAVAIQEGVAAYQAGQMDVATSRLGRAVQLAHNMNDAEMTSRLSKMVDILDPNQGTVRVKKVDKEIAMKLDSASTRRAVKKPQPEEAIGTTRVRPE